MGRSPPFREGPPSKHTTKAARASAKHDLVAYGMLTIAVSTYDGAAVAAKIAVRSLPPLASASLRFALASVALAIMVAAMPRLRGRWPQARELPVLALAGASGIALFNVCYFIGVQYTTASEANLVASSNPLITVVLAAFFLHERLGASGALGTLLSLLGVALLVLGSSPTAEATNPALGDLIVGGSALGWALFTLAARVAARRLSALMITFYGAVIGTLMMLPFGLWELAHWRPQPLPLDFWLAMAFLAFGTSLFGFFGWIIGVRRIGASRASIFNNLSPVIAVALGGLILGERLSAAQLGGVALVLLGLWLVNRRPAAVDEVGHRA